MSPSKEVLARLSEQGRIRRIRVLHGGGPVARGCASPSRREADRHKVKAAGDGSSAGSSAGSPAAAPHQRPKEAEAPRPTCARAEATPSRLPRRRPPAGHARRAACPSLGRPPARDRALRRRAEPAPRVPRVGSDRSPLSTAGRPSDTPSSRPQPGPGGPRPGAPRPGMSPSDMPPRPSEHPAPASGWRSAPRPRWRSPSRCGPGRPSPGGGGSSGSAAAAPSSGGGAAPGGFGDVQRRWCARPARRCGRCVRSARRCANVGISRSGGTVPSTREHAGARRRWRSAAARQQQTIRLARGRWLDDFAEKINADPAALVRRCSTSARW